MAMALSIQDNTQVRDGSKAGGEFATEKALKNKERSLMRALLAN
jgi:hypothetical protein